MTLQDQAQTIRFFEGLGKPLSTREVEILLEEDRLNIFLSGDGKEGGFEGLDPVMDEKRACAECQYFAAGHYTSYCYEFHRPREVGPRDTGCEWFKRRG